MKIPRKHQVIVLNIAMLLTAWLCRNSYRGGVLVAGTVLGLLVGNVVWVIAVRRSQIPENGNEAARQMWFGSDPRRRAIIWASIAGCTVLSTILAVYSGNWFLFTGGPGGGYLVGLGIHRVVRCKHSKAND
jgi:hypothetical protein